MIDDSLGAQWLLCLLYVLYRTAICVWFCSCLFIVCSNVSEYLMCLVLFLSLLMYVFQKLSYSLCRLCLSFLTNSSSDSKAFLRLIVIPASSTTAVHCAFLFFDVKAWPQSQADLFTCTTVLHCGIPFWTCYKRQSQTSRFDGKNHNTMSSKLHDHTLPLHNYVLHSFRQNGFNAFSEL